MANLTVENLSGMLQSGDVEGTMGGLRIPTPTAPEAQVLREMAKQGMPTPEQAGVAPASGSFGDMLQKSIDEVNRHQHEADRAVKEMVAGRNKNIHETMLTLERADTSLKMMMQVRNKVLEAYKEIMKMQV